MRLIAKKPCKFDRPYYIGEEIPVEVVKDPKKQEQLGVIVIADGEGSGASGVPGALFTKEQFDKKVAEEVEAKVAEKLAEISSEQPQAGAIQPETINLPIMTDNGGFEANMSITSVVDAIVIMQKNAKDAEKAIAEVEDDDVLMILSAADSRKTVKDASTKRHEEIQADGTGGDADGKEL